MTELSPALVRRLPQYFRILIKFYGSGKERISSEELASELDLVPSQVRTDLKALGCVGQRSYGYGIPALYKKITDILQLSDKFSAVIVGASGMIKAIADTEVFTKRGIKLCAVFSDDEGSWDESPAYSVHPFDFFEEYLLSSSPSIILLGGSPASASGALAIAEKMQTDAPVIWNFTHSPLYSDKITVKNIHLSDCLMLLCYEMGKDAKE